MAEQQSQPSLWEHELAEAVKALEGDHEALQAKASALQKDQDEAYHRADSLTVELNDCRAQLQEALVGQQQALAQQEDWDGALLRAESLSG